MKRYDVVIVGGGPAGLSCARELSKSGASVLLLERKKTIGAKVCAGGITWDGLIQKVPEELIERIFHEQHIFSGRQRFCFRKDKPVIATVDRVKLGQWMLQEAQSAGTETAAGWHVRRIEGRTVTATREHDRMQVRFDHLVGADGSSSQVRKFLALPITFRGIGINYQVRKHYDNMEWHLHPRYFGNGYGWIFPHRESVSIGAYRAGSGLSPRVLKRNLINWAMSRGFKLENENARAELINYDYRGFHFGNIWLAGDAAGLASGLTGEGIHPAILSGRAVARKILDRYYQTDEINRLLAKKRQHEMLVRTTGRSRTACSIIMELLLLAIRLKIVDFQQQLSM